MKSAYESEGFRPAMVQQSSSNSPAKNDPPHQRGYIYFRNPLFPSGSKECHRSRFRQSFSGGFPSCISFDDVMGRPTRKIEQKLRRNPFSDSGSTHFGRRVLLGPFLIRYKADFVQVDPLFEDQWISVQFAVVKSHSSKVKRRFLPIIQRWVESVGV